MKTNVQVTEFTHDDLVNIISTATYGNSYIDIDVPTESKELYKKSNEDCWEDKLADVLLNGGTLKIIDCQSEETKDMKTWDINGNNHLSVSWEEFETWNPEDQGKYGHLAYHINLQNLLSGCSNEKAYKYLKELLIDEEGDMWTAYNLLQVAIWGNEIYG